MSWRDLGEQIKRLREAAGLTQEELGERAGLSRMYVQMIERGERPSPSLPALERIARALNATLRVDLQPSRTRGGRHGR
jgi:transcriptional regulator with XRE-family HTH domain